MNQLLFIFLLLTTSVPFVLADAPSTQSVDDQLFQLQKQLESVKTVQADFVQEKKLPVFNRTMILKGRFALDRPNRLIWHVHEPVRYTIRIDGDQVRQWDQDTDRVQTINLGDNAAFKVAFGQFKGWFLGDYRSLLESYNVTSKTQTYPILIFTPKPDSPISSMVKQVDLTFSPDGTYIDTLVVQEESGDLTTIRFLNTSINKPLDEKIWEIPPHDR